MTASAACATCLVAIEAAGAPDEAAQVAAFDRAHPPGPDHQRVAKLPPNRGDAQPGWTPGSGRPWPGRRRL